MKKRITQSIFAAFGIILLILDSRTALKGMQSGITLCLQSVIPSIFPFLVLSGMLTSVMIGTNFRFLQPVSRLLGIPRGTECIYLTGIIGGYPTGAQAVHDAWERGQLSTKDARRMLGFCNNAGPSFLFGIVGSQFPELWMPWLLWGIHILSSVIVGAILPGKSQNCNQITGNADISLNQSLKRAVVTMGYICGWVVLIRCILAFLDRWVLWIIPTSARVGIFGLLELANGCCNLQSIDNLALRFVICSVILAFGGFCVFMQTASVTGKLGLGYYLPVKLMHAVTSLLLSFIMQRFLFPDTDRIIFPILLLPIVLIIVLILYICARKVKNKGSIPALYGV